MVNSLLRVVSEAEDFYEDSFRQELALEFRQIGEAIRNGLDEDDKSSIDDCLIRYASDLKEAGMNFRAKAVLRSLSDD